MHKKESCLNYEKVLLYSDSVECRWRSAVQKWGIMSQPVFETKTASQNQ